MLVNLANKIFFNFYIYPEKLNNKKLFFIFIETISSRLLLSAFIRFVSKT